MSDGYDSLLNVPIRFEVSGEAGHVVTSTEQSIDEAPTHAARGADDENSHQCRTPRPYSRHHP